MHNLHNDFTQSEFELDPEYLGEYNQESAYNNEFQEEITSQEGTFNEATQMELASELLSVSNEAELDQFLGKLIKKGAGAAGRFLKSKTGRALGGVLKNVVKKALPMAGGAIGTALLPGLGTSIGGALGNAASNMFELELEGLSHEDQEFETARAFVRFAGNAVRQAVTSPQDQPEGEVARRAVARSARRYAPGILRRRGYTRGYRGERFNAFPNQGFGSLNERVRRLEDIVQDLSAQVQAGGNSSLPPSDQEFFGY